MASPAGTEMLAGDVFPASLLCWADVALLDPVGDCLPLPFSTGTSGELGGIRQIKMEPDELNIIQITVPGSCWGSVCAVPAVQAAFAA